MKMSKQLLTWQSNTLSNYIAEISLHKSINTVSAYRFDITDFFDYMTSRGGAKRPSSLKKKIIVDYLGNCNLRGLSDTTINRRFMALKSFCCYLQKAGLLPEDPTKDILAPRVAVKALQVPNFQQVTQVLSKPDVSNEDGARDKAILELLYSSGLRASEIVNLDFCHFADNCVIVSCGKRNKTRTVPITPSAKDSISFYIQNFRGDSTGPLFKNRLNRRLQRARPTEILKKYTQGTDIKDLTAHTLRHACATHLLDAGANIVLIQQVLGHASIATTQRYTHMSSATIQDKFQQFHPRATNGA